VLLLINDHPTNRCGVSVQNALEGRAAASVVEHVLSAPSWESNVWATVEDRARSPIKLSSSALGVDVLRDYPVTPSHLTCLEITFAQARRDVTHDSSEDQWFTLIELLVVVAIIAVLVGRPAAGLQTARARAREVTCLANVRQWSIALDDVPPGQRRPPHTLPVASRVPLEYHLELYLMDLGYVKDKGAIRLPGPVDRTR